MADTQRTKAAILSLMSDNVTGQISAQDLRDMIVTIMESEFANPGDFWARPQAKYITTDKTAKGAKMYSQYIASAVSWMNVLYQDNSTGQWMLADLAASAKNIGRLALAMDSYAAGYSTATVLLEGIVYDSTFSAVFSRKIGRPVYLDSGVPGSISVGLTTLSVRVLGFVANSDNSNDSAIGKWYFDGTIGWAARGV
jgi:hypothetical protein